MRRHSIRKSGNTLVLLIMGSFVISSCSMTPTTMQSDMQNCIKTIADIDNRTSLSRNTFTKDFPLEYASPSFDYFAGATQVCDLGQDKKFAAFVYLTKAVNGGERQIHTEYLILDENNSVLQSSDIACPFMDDVKAANPIEVADNQLLVECVTAGSGGAESGMEFSIKEYHVINLENFSNTRVWHEDSESVNGKISNENKIDETQKTTPDIQKIILEREAGK